MKYLLDRIGPLGIMIMTLGFSLAAAFFAWTQAYHAAALHAEARFEEQTTELREACRQRLREYELALAGAQALFRASKTVEYDEWIEYHHATQRTGRPRGINALFYIARVPPQEIGNFESSVRREGLPHFSVKKEGAFPPGRDSFVVTFSTQDPEPLLGTDIASFPSLRAAALEARDYDQPVLVLLIQPSESADPITSLWLLLPIYKNGVAHVTVPQRREAVLGWVAAKINIQAMVESLEISSSSPRFQLLLRDRNNSVVPVYGALKNIDATPTPHTSVWSSNDHLRSMDILGVGGQQLILLTESPYPLRELVDSTLPLLVLLSAILSATLLVTIIWSLTSARRQAEELAAEMTTSLRKNEAELVRYITELEETRSQLEQQAALLARQAEELGEARDRAEAATRAKSEFLANMSHEIRTPMNAVVGVGELLIETDLNDYQRDLVRTYQSASEALLSTINDILDFSKIEAGKLELTPEPTDLGQLLRDCYFLFAVPAKNKGLALSLSVPTELPNLVLADAHHLRQVLTNFLGNAVKFVEPGGSIVCEAILSHLDERSATVRFSVKDTGIGIPPEKLESIFQPFTQADATMTRRFGGTGLGLAISSQLVKMMGGEITVESSPGKGSTFSFELSFPVVARDPEARESTPRGENLVRLQPLRILLAEDNIVNQKVLVRFLEREGHAVTVANNGREAIERCSAHQFDVILMDIQMPEMDGLQATRTLRENPEFQAVPIIALSANAIHGDAERYLSCGLTGYLSKPVRREELLAMLVKVTRGVEPYVSQYMSC